MPFMIENTSKSRYIFHFKQIIKRSAPKMYQILIRLLSFLLVIT